MKKFIIAAAVATLGATPALAQTEAGQLVGGPRVEAVVGWDRAVAHLDDVGSAGKSGVTYGAEIGYDFPLSDYIIVGPYVGIDGASTKECISGGTETLCGKAGRNITVGARLGTNIAKRTAFYIKGGYSNGRVTVTYTDTAVPADNLSGHENMDGFHVGTGVQLGLRDRIYTKLEYNYTRYSTYELAGYSGRFDRHRVVVGLGISF